MRHLHAWNDPRGITPVGQEACADDGRNPRRTLGQSVPLHRVHADFRSGGRCGAQLDNKMRSDPQDYQLIAPGTLHAVVSLLAKEPGAWLPIAGGTDVMVLYAAGKLPARKLVNIWNLPELRRIEVFSDEIRIGAGCTYTELREQEIVGREFPLLARAAAWTGGIANQNRGTVGGNIGNASPAADSAPPLLAYDASLRLRSLSDERVVPYRNFHTGYKQMDLRPGELITEIHLPRKFAGCKHYARKVGARKAQAISKVCFNGLVRLEGKTVTGVAVTLGSVAPTPIRCFAAESELLGREITPEVIARA